jgi:hypothetical protein
VIEHSLARLQEVKHRAESVVPVKEEILRAAERRNAAEGKEYALAAVAEREKQSERAAQEFYDGYVQGFHRVVSLMPQQAQAFGIDLKDLQLEGVEPDRDLV